MAGELGLGHEFGHEDQKDAVNFQDVIAKVDGAVASDAALHLPGVTEPAMVTMESEVLSDSAENGGGGAGMFDGLALG
jgi:hypothetical protein